LKSCEESWSNGPNLIKELRNTLKNRDSFNLSLVSLHRYGLEKIGHWSSSNEKLEINEQKQILPPIHTKIPDKDESINKTLTVTTLIV
jgi:hypothetical protein